MADIDEKVVSMKFDNAAFQRNLEETIQSLDKLKQSLNFTNSTRGMEELSSASKNVNLSPIADSVDGISSKFLALSTVAITALATITTHAVMAGARIVKSLSFGPIQDGFREFETNMNSIQTILANTDSKGTTLAEVNKALDQLNTYSDQTIYNFSEMARNIGTFTAAGVNLDASVNSIKGIANLAAISGSNSEQASTAMYQLSQALASGTVKLMDWNSVVNAGMGGEVFQKALFNAGKAANTLTDVPVGQTFEQWKDAGNSFRDSLKDGWITAEVLTNTLSGFTGDLTEAQIMSMGYTKDQAAEVMRLGKIGKAAATEVKTFTQLISTVKESVASGWSSSFRIIIGDFEESKKLFTGISTALGRVIGNSSDARNKVLKDWKDLGGRDTFIEGLENSLTAVGRILGPISQGFRDVFPPMTGQRLLEITQAFANFTAKLSTSYEAGQKIRSLFGGLFSIFDIGKTIIIEFVKFLGGFVGSLSGVGSGALDLGQKLGIALRIFQSMLVEQGGIHNFFVKLAEVIRKPIEVIRELTSAIVEFFKGFSENRQVEAGLARLENRFDSLSNASKRLSGFFDSIKKTFGEVFDYIKTWFSQLGAKLAEAFHPGDFNSAIDIVNVGLLGGIILMLKKFIKNGFKFDIGGGILEKVSGALEGLTGTLKSMQANVKADTLMKIALAVGVLTASIVVLSLIDSGALTKAMVAMTVGFGQLIAAMSLLENIGSGFLSSAKVGVLAAGMILVASAMVILSIAIKNLSSLSWGELTKGLIGISVGLAAMVAAMHLLPPAPGMIASGIAMSAIAISLILLSKAVASFSGLSWAEMAKGLAGVAGGLVIIAGAMWLMPPGMVATGLGLIALSAGLLILAKATEAFSKMSWGEIAKGLLGIGGALVVIAGAMWLMPPGMILTASGLLILSVALNVMAKAVQALGAMKMGEIVKGLGALAAMLGILAGAMILMTGTLSGAAALLIVSGALVTLTGVLKILGNMSISSIVTGLAALAGTFIVLGVAALLLGPVVPILYSLGLALTLLGTGFALFGVGAMLVAKAFEMLAQAGKTGISVLIEVIKMFIAALPEFVGAFIKSIVDMASELIAAAPLFLRLITALLLQILETVVTLAPQIGAAIGAIVITGLRIIRELFPDIVTTGFLMLMEFLRGVRDNIGEITTLGVDIVVNLVAGLINNMSKMVDSGFNLLMAFLNAISDRAGEIVSAGLNLLLNLLLGIADNIDKVVATATQIVTTFITEIGNNATNFVTSGLDALINFINGISNNLIKVSNAATDLVVEFINGIAANSLKVITAAADMVIDFLNGLAAVIREKSGEFREAGRNIAGAIVEGMLGGLRDSPVIGAAVRMAQGVVGAVKGVFSIFSPSKVFRDIGRNVVSSLASVLENDKTAQNSAVVQAERIVSVFHESLNKIPDSIAGLSDLTPVITPVLDLTNVQRESKNLSGILSGTSIRPDVSYKQARTISNLNEIDSNKDVGPDNSAPREISFQQNNYSPKALSTNDIYRNTRSQIALAKEELGIL